MTKSLILDLYNTLIYSSVRVKPYLDLFKSMGLSKEEMSIWRLRVMTQNFSSFEELRDSIDSTSTLHVDKYNYDIKVENSHTFMFDDTIQFLDYVSKKYDLYLLSNISTPYKECFFQLGLEKWIVPYFSCDIGFAKPQPEAFELILKERGLKKNEVIMIGDSKSSDYGGATNIGIKAILKNGSLLDVIEKLKEGG